MENENKNEGRWREWGITSTALTAARVDEAPGRPGAELTPWAAGEAAGGARSPTGAVSSRGRAAQRLEELSAREVIPETGWAP
ncbi:MAG: hypothetical protein LM580_05235 [Thermofilum sp.]|nr:hypothetical protein [Thermofilum sp.]